MSVLGIEKVIAKYHKNTSVSGEEVLRVLKNGSLGVVLDRGWKVEFEKEFNGRFGILCDAIYNFMSVPVMHKRAIRLNNFNLYSALTPKMIHLTCRAGNFQYSMGLCLERLDMFYVWQPEVLAFYKLNFTYHSLYMKSLTFDEIYEGQSREEKSGSGTKVSYVHRYSKNYLMILFFKLIDGKGVLYDPKKIMKKDFFLPEMFAMYVSGPLTRLDLNTIKVKDMSVELIDKFKIKVLGRIKEQLQALGVVVEEKKITLGKRKRKSEGKGGKGVSKRAKRKCKKCDKEYSVTLNGEIRRHKCKKKSK